MASSLCVSILSVLPDIFLEKMYDVALYETWRIPFSLKIINLRGMCHSLVFAAGCPRLANGSITPHHPDGFIEVAHLISHLHAADSLCVGLLPDDLPDPQAKYKLGQTG